MEAYLHYLKTLRSQMNDVEEQVAKISFEEQMHISTVQTLERDLELAKVEIQRLQEESENMIKSKGQVCCEIFEKQRKIASLESDSSTLVQSLKLIQQERESLSTKLVEKSTFYTKVAEDITSNLKEHQDWVDAHQNGSPNCGNGLGENEADAKPFESKDSHDDTVGLMENLGAAQVRFNQLTEQKSMLISMYSKVKESTNTVNTKINEFKRELGVVDDISLEDEFQALLSDKAGVTEYMQSLQLQILKLKDISSMVKCSCGEDFMIDLGACMSTGEV